MPVTKERSCLGQFESASTPGAIGGEERWVPIGPVGSTLGEGQSSEKGGGGLEEDKVAPPHLPAQMDPL